MENASVFRSTKYAWYGYLNICSFDLCLCVGDFCKNLSGFFLWIFLSYTHLILCKSRKIVVWLNYCFVVEIRATMKIKSE